MAKLSHVWMVINPEGGSTLRDFIWRQDVIGLESQMRGGVPGWWRKSNGAVHVTKKTALDDALARIQARLPPAERDLAKKWFRDHIREID